MIKSSAWIWAGLLGGAAVGVPLAQRIQMTAMPQLVAALHSFVGLVWLVPALLLYLGIMWFLRNLFVDESDPAQKRTAAGGPRAA